MSWAVGVVCCRGERPGAVRNRHAESIRVLWLSSHLFPRPGRTPPEPVLLHTRPPAPTTRLQIPPSGDYAHCHRGGSIADTLEAHKTCRGSTHAWDPVNQYFCTDTQAHTSTHPSAAFFFYSHRPRPYRSTAHSCSSVERTQRPSAIHTAQRFPPLCWALRAARLLPP